MARPSAVTPEQALAIVLTYPGMSAAQISKALGVSKEAVWRVTKEAGLRKYGPGATARRQARPVARVAEPPPRRRAAATDDPLAIVTAALTQALQASADGDPAAAQAHLKAGVEAARLAETLRLMRREESFEDDNP